MVSVNYGVKTWLTGGRRFVVEGMFLCVKSFFSADAGSSQQHSLSRQAFRFKMTKEHNFLQEQDQIWQQAHIRFGLHQTFGFTAVCVGVR